MDGKKYRSKNKLTAGQTDGRTNGKTSFIHSFIHSLIHSFTHSRTRSFTYSPRSFTCILFLTQSTNYDSTRLTNEIVYQCIKLQERLYFILVSLFIHSEPYIMIFPPEVLSQLPVSKTLLSSWIEFVLRTCRGFIICCCFLFLGYLGLYQLPDLHQCPAHKEREDDPLHRTEGNCGWRNTHEEMKSQERQVTQGVTHKDEVRCCEVLEV